MVRGGIVHCNHFKVSEGLVQTAIETAVDYACPVMGSDDKAEVWHLCYLAA